MTYLVNMTEDEWRDVNRLKISQMRMILHRARLVQEMTHQDDLAYNIDNVIIAVNKKDARAYFALQEQPARPDGIQLFEPLDRRQDPKPVVNQEAK